MDSNLKDLLEVSAVKYSLELDLGMEHSQECTCKLCSLKEKERVKLSSVSVELEFEIGLNIETILPPVLPSLLMEIELEENIAHPKRDERI